MVTQRAIRVAWGVCSRSSDRLVLASTAPGWGRWVPLPIDDGYGNILAQLEVLHLDVDASYMRGDERGTDNDRDRGLVCDHERYPERDP